MLQYWGLVQASLYSATADTATLCTATYLFKPQLHSSPIIKHCGFPINRPSIMDQHKHLLIIHLTMHLQAIELQIAWHCRQRKGVHTSPCYNSAICIPPCKNSPIVLTIPMKELNLHLYVAAISVNLHLLYSNPHRLLPED